MSELQVITNHTTSDKIELPSFELPQNYSILINKLEQLALGVDAAFGNISVDHKALEISVSGANDVSEDFLLHAPIAAGRAPPPHATHGHGLNGDVEYTRVVSDIWIGVILTLLIVSVVFFICSCFVYHKFQQWKNSYRTNPNEPVEICRHYVPDFEVESLPSYTIVSGLPTYDDALEEFRKAGIILTPPMPVIKIFERETKDNQIYNLESNINANGTELPADNISLSSNTCSCGAANGNGVALANSPAAQVIELSPEQLAALSQKRLSLQIAFNNSVRRNSRQRVDLYRQVNRNNMLRSHAVGGGGVGNVATIEALPPIHRSSSTFSLSLANEQRNIQDYHLHHLQHRGSLC